MTRWLVIFGLVLSGGVALANNDDTTGTMGQQQQQGSSAAMVPTGAKLVGSTSAAEVRAFPEMSKTKTAEEEVVGARAVDRVYETNKSYKNTVGYFDKMVKNGRAEQMQRTVTRTATGWSLKLPDGTIQNVVVRNTRPTTIETVKATAAVGEEPGAPSGMKKEMNTPPSGSEGTMSPRTTPTPSPSGTSPSGTTPNEVNPNQPNPNQPNQPNPSGTTPSNP